MGQKLIEGQVLWPHGQKHVDLWKCIQNNGWRIQMPWAYSRTYMWSHLHVPLPRTRVADTKGTSNVATNKSIWSHHVTDICQLTAHCQGSYLILACKAKRYCDEDESRSRMQAKTLSTKTCHFAHLHLFFHSPRQKSAYSPSRLQVIYIVQRGQVSHVWESISSLNVLGKQLNFLRTCKPVPDSFGQIPRNAFQFHHT